MLGEQIQAAGLRRFDVRRRSHEGDADNDWFVKWSADCSGDCSTRQLAAHDVDKARSAVGHRGQIKFVSRSNSLPAGGHGLGSLASSQGALEVIGGNEHSHAATVSGGLRGCR